MAAPHMSQLPHGVGGEPMLSFPPRVGELQRMNREKRSAMLEYERSRQQLQQQQVNPHMLFNSRPMVPTSSGALDDVSWMTEAEGPSAGPPWAASADLDMQSLLDQGLAGVGGDPIVTRSEWCQHGVPGHIWNDRSTRALWDLVDDSEVSAALSLSLFLSPLSLSLSLSFLCRYHLEVNATI